MRIHTFVGLILERYVPKGGVTVENTHFKEGTIVGINAWVLHHDEIVFESPDNFIPERWLTDDKKKLKKMEKSIFTFGFGARSCVGKNFSLIEMSKIIPQLLLNYNMRLASGTDWSISNEWFVQQANMICVINKREPGGHQ